jgi:hypothetical protein
LITSGDTGTVTNTMLPAPIADSKLLQITTAGKLRLVHCRYIVWEQQQCCSFNSKYNCWNGVNHFHIFVGALTGNATATALAAGRNSGIEATFTTGAFDGTGNVSGAVTLLNSAVINKVLTGYASGPGVVAATDSILAAIQKLKYCP